MILDKVREDGPGVFTDQCFGALTQELGVPPIYPTVYEVVVHVCDAYRDGRKQSPEKDLIRFLFLMFINQKLELSCKAALLCFCPVGAGTHRLVAFAGVHAHKTSPDRREYNVCFACFAWVEPNRSCNQAGARPHRVALGISATVGRRSQEAAWRPLPFMPRGIPPAGQNNEAVLTLRTWSTIPAIAVLAASLGACSPPVAQLSGSGLAVPTATVSLAGVQLTLVLPAGPDLPAASRQIRAILPAKRYRITIRAHDIDSPLTAEATGAADAATIEVAGVSPGNNRLVALQALDDAGADIPGAAWMAVATLVSNRNRVTLSAGSTAVGSVWRRWLDAGKTALASAQDPAVVGRKLVALKEGGNLPHLAFVDAAKWADAAGAAGNLEVGTSGFGITPAALDVTIEGAPAAVPADIWVDDPASPLQAGLSRLTSQSGRYQVSPVLPGTWTVRANVPGLGTLSKAVTLAAGATSDVTLAFDGWKAGPDLPAPLGNSSAATDGRYIYLVGGATSEFTTSGGVRLAGGATSSCWVLDTSLPSPTWTDLPALPVAREGAAVGISAGKLIVAGGINGSSDFLDGYSLNLADPQGWTQISSPQSLVPVCQNDSCEPGIPVGAFDDGGRPVLLWTVFDDLPVPPWALGHTHRWDPDSAVWVRDPADIPPIRTPRARVGVGVVSGFAVVAGGNSEAIREGNAWKGSLMSSLATVEAFDLAGRKWVSWPDLPTPRSELSVAGASGSLYAAGGVDFHDYALDVVERYDTSKQVWYPAPALREPRSSFPLVFAGGKLWAIGGSPARRMNRYVPSWPGSALAMKSVETLTVGESR